MYNQDFLVIKEDEEAIKENISRILMTLPGERVNNPFFGSKLKNYLFDLNVIMNEDIKQEIVSAITRWEPRVIVNSIETESIDDKTLLVDFRLIFKETLEPFTYEVLVRL